MLSESNAKRFCVTECATHQRWALYSGAIISEESHTKFSHLGHWSKQLSFSPLGDSSSDCNINRSSCTLVEDIGNECDIVKGRFGVWHRDNGGVATHEGCKRTTFDCFCFFTTRFTKVCVDVYEPRSNPAILRINLNGSAWCVNFLGNCGDLSVNNQNVSNFFTGGAVHESLSKYVISHCLILHSIQRLLSTAQPFELAHHL